MELALCFLSITSVLALLVATGNAVRISKLEKVLKSASDVFIAQGNYNAQMFQKIRALQKTEPRQENRTEVH